MLPTPRYRLRQLPLGQDDGSDFMDSSSLDSMMAATPVPSTYDIPDVTAPNISDTSFYAGVGPVAPGELPSPFVGVDNPLTAPSTDINSLILSGEMPPPVGTLTPAQVSQLSAAGANPSDIGAILSGSSSFAKTLSQLTQIAATAGRSVQQLTSAPAGRPGPVTCPTGYSAQITSTGAGTCVISPLSSLAASSIIPGLPNWMVGLIAIAGVALIAGGKR